MAKDVIIQGEESLRRTLVRLSRGISAKQVLDEIGLYLTTSIKTRVQNDNEDIHGQTFAPYVPKYSLWRTKKGYGTAVDLTLTGSMFASLTHTTSSEKVTIYFMPGTGRSVKGGSSKVSNPAKAFYIQEKREFFGYTAEDVTNIMNLYSVHIGDVIDGD